MADGPQLHAYETFPVLVGMRSTDCTKLCCQQMLALPPILLHLCYQFCRSSTGTFHVLFGVATAPIGRVKLMIQCQDEMIKSSRLPKPYKGIVNCFARTISNEGLLSLWRGYIPSVIRSFSFRVISFGLHNYCLTLFNFKKDNDGYWNWLLGGFAVGTFADLATRVVVYPLDYAQTRLANDIKTNNKIEERQF